MNIQQFWSDVLAQRADEIKEYLIVTATRVYPKDRSASFHVTSFIKLKDDKITAMDEYWADDGEAPKWRQDMKIGRKIDYI